MIVYLLDVNVLLALCDSLHLHHEAAHRWFGQHGRTAWATCPITENGFVRIASHPNYPNRPGDVAAVLEILRRLCAVTGHQFWMDDLALRDFLLPGIITHAHVTDIYFLGLAARKGGKLATFDRRIPAAAIQDGKNFLELIPS